MTETILTNARIVLPDAVIDGSVAVAGDADRRGSDRPQLASPGALDLDGDYLIPGVVDVHTDNLERQVQPRNNARWPSRSAMLAHDAQCAAAGVTTVLDALCLGDLGFDKERIRTFRDGVADLDALADTGLLKSEHFLHLRCEMPATDVLDLVDPVADHPRVRMISLMDHSPGVGQYADLDRYRALRRKRRRAGRRHRAPHRRTDRPSAPAMRDPEPPRPARPRRRTRRAARQPRRPDRGGNRARTSPTASASANSR